MRTFNFFYNYHGEENKSVRVYSVSANAPLDYYINDFLRNFKGIAWLIVKNEEGDILFDSEGEYND